MSVFYRSDVVALPEANASCRVCCPAETPRRLRLNICSECRTNYNATYPNHPPTANRWDVFRDGLLDARANKEGLGEMIYRLKLAGIE